MHDDEDSVNFTETLYDLALKNINNNEIIVDIGCGRIDYLGDLNNYLVGIDFSLSAIKKFKLKIKEYKERIKECIAYLKKDKKDKFYKKLYNREIKELQELLDNSHNVNLILADARYLPLREKCADTLICSGTLEHLTNIKKRIKELSKISNKLFLALPAKDAFEKSSKMNSGYTMKEDLCFEETDFGCMKRKCFTIEKIVKLLVPYFNSINIKTHFMRDVIHLNSIYAPWPYDLPPPDTKAVYYMFAEKS